MQTQKRNFGAKDVYRQIYHFEDIQVTTNSSSHVNTKTVEANQKRKNCQSEAMCTDRCPVRESQD